MAHGDHELIPKALKQQINRNQREAAAAALAAQREQDDAVPVRQREGPDELSSDDDANGTTAQEDITGHFSAADVSEEADGHYER